MCIDCSAMPLIRNDRRYFLLVFGGIELYSIRSDRGSFIGHLVLIMISVRELQKLQNFRIQDSETTMHKTSNKSLKISNKRFMMVLEVEKK